MNKVIGSVRQVREYKSSYGDKEAVDGTFQDGDGWSISTNKGKGAALKAQLDALIGKPLEGFTVEPAMVKETGEQRKYQGKLQWTLKAVQQQGGRGWGGGGGGKGWTEAYSQSKEAFDLTRRSIQRQTALKIAADVSIAQKLFSGETIVDLAKLFDGFLSIDPPPATDKPGNPEDLMADFAAALKAATAERQSKGKSRVDSTVVAEALNLRGWTIDGFRSWSELQEALGPERFRKLTKAIDLNPCNFEKETHREENA